MNPKTSSMLLAGICLVLGALAVSQTLRANRLKAELDRIAALKESAPPRPVEPEGPAPAISSPAPAPAHVPTPSTIGSGRVDGASKDVPEREAAATQQLEKAHELIAALVEEREETKKDARNNPFSAISKMMDAPEMKDMLAQQARMGVDLTYGKFFDRLEADPETKTALKELLLTRQMGMMDSGMSLMQGGQSDRESIQQTMKEKNQEFEDAVKALVGEEGSKQLKEWETRIPKQMVVDQFARTLGGENRLNPEQEEQLVTLMVNRDKMAQDNPPTAFDPNTFEPEKIGPDAFSEENMNAMIEYQARQNEAYLEDARLILNETQHRALEASLKQQQAMMEMGIRMGAQMFKAREEAAAPSTPAAK